MVTTEQLGPEIILTKIQAPQPRGGPIQGLGLLDRLTSARDVPSTLARAPEVYFRYTESTSWIAPYIKSQIPLVCDLVADPQETIDLMRSDLTAGWVIGATVSPVIALEQSAQQFRHVKVGEEDFNGYD